MVPDIVSEWKGCARSGWCSHTQGGELRDPLGGISLANDRVAAVDRLGLMTDQLHGTDRGTPVRSKFRTAVLRKSCGSIPTGAARRQAFRQAVRKLLIGWPRLWK